MGLVISRGIAIGPFNYIEQNGCLEVLIGLFSYNKLRKYMKAKRASNRESRSRAEHASSDSLAQRAGSTLNWKMPDFLFMTLADVPSDPC